MITIWNRREVFIGHDLEEFNEVRNALSSNGIRYTYKVVDSTSPGFFGASNRARTGTFGIEMKYTKTYYIYVHKKDYDNSKAILRN